MGFLERAIRKGVSQGVGRAVGEALSKAIEPHANELANKAAQRIDEAAAKNEEYENQRRQNSAFNGAFANLERAANDYATQLGKNMKICPGCGETVTADKKFCPHCGAKLPEQTVAEGAVCPNCGKQNSIGTKFCQDCGTKLPAAVAEEQAQLMKDDAVMAEWNEKLAAFPKWIFGGKDYYIEDYDGGAFSFTATFATYAGAQSAVRQYRELLLQNGFRQAGQYPNMEHLYKRTDGIVYHADTEHCFEGDPECPQIYFDRSEPTGGFDYVKPEPKKQLELKDLKGLFKR
ncbi:MAG: zinc ribbon domain-containing protein [Oscillospiraceae bacterium]|nr:zinc ribbon domain-containing protein [Oscillospiraceae bacterium]